MNICGTAVERMSSFKYLATTIISVQCDPEKQGGASLSENIWETINGYNQTAHNIFLEFYESNEIPPFTNNNNNNHSFTD